MRAEARWFEFLLREYGGAVVAGCRSCGRKLPPKGLNVTRRWANERGYCLCGIPYSPILKDKMDRWMLWQLMHMVPRTVCDDLFCERCRR